MDWDFIGTRYTCNANEIQNREISHVTQILGNHMPDRSNNNIEGFTTNGDVAFLTFPGDLNSFFPNLLGMGMYGGEISSISSDDLAPWPNLTTFSARNNRFESIDGNLFQNTPRLQYIRLNSNLIRNVGVNLLSHLNGLYVVDFANNTCIDTRAETRYEMEDLIMELIENCPPLATPEPSTTISSTTADSCSPRCSINEEVDQLRALTGDQAIIIDDLTEIVSDLRRRIEQLESSQVNKV